MRFRPTEEQIRTWIENNIDKYKIRKGGEEYIIANPFYHNDKMKFNINVSKSVAHDWRGDSWAGGSSPTFLRFVQLFNRCSFAEAIKDVCGESVNFRSITRKIEKQRHEKHLEEAHHHQQIELVLPEGSTKILESPYPKMSAIVINYLESRGINKDLIKQYDLHHTSNNVIWPYYEYEELVYYQSRNVVNKIFDFPSSINKGDYLYGFDYVEPSDYLVVTEAIIDAITLGTQCTATGGAGISRMQVRKIRALNPIDGVILAPDNDKAGIKSIIHDYRELSPYFKTYYAFPPKAYNGIDIKDWNDLGKLIGFDETRKIFEKSVSVLDVGAIASLIRSF